MTKNNILIFRSLAVAVLLLGMREKKGSNVNQHVIPSCISAFCTAEASKILQK